MQLILMGLIARREADRARDRNSRDARLVAISNKARLILATSSQGF